MVKLYFNIINQDQHKADKNNLNFNSTIYLILPFLDYLSIFELKYTNSFFKNKITLRGLDQILDLRNVNIINENNTIYKILKKHKFLKEIVIEFRKINDTHIFQIDSDKELINLNGCHNITDKSVIHISTKCPSLKRVELYWIPNITDKGLSALLSNCHNITYLNISGLKHVTIESLRLIPQNLKNLDTINLTRCVGVTDEFLDSLLENLNLKYLNLYALPYLKCTFMKFLSNRKENCRLEFLDLCGNTTITDEVFTHFKGTNALKNLAYLNLSWCKQITDTTFEVLYEQLDNLGLLSLHGLLGISDRTIDLLYENTNLIQKLHTLDLYGCMKVLNKEKEYLKQKFPKLECVRYHF